MPSNRKYNVIVWGATGLTGYLVCEWITKKYMGQIKWAIAGRSHAKLQMVKQNLSKIDKRAEEIDTLYAQLDIPHSLDGFVCQAEVVITTVGPYTIYGTPLVESAIRCQTHLCDLTAEVPWVMDMVDKFHKKAEDKGVKIVSFCGMEVVPFDITTYELQDYALKKYGVPCKEVVPIMDISPFSGISLGTIESIIYSFKYYPEKSKEMKSVYCLAKDEKLKVHDREDYWYKYDNKFKKTWLVGSVMQISSTRTFRRTNYLLKHKYGDNAQYNEYIDVKLFPLALISAYLINLIFFLFSLQVFRQIFHSIYRGLNYFFGFGPSRFLMERIYWRVRSYGVLQDPQTGKEKILYTSVKGNHDAAYMDSAQMLLETALALTLDKDSIAKENLPQGGVLTPAVATGRALFKRLQQSSEFNVEQIMELQ